MAKLEYIVVVGSSAGGTFAIEDLVPALNLEHSAVLLVPHIERRKINDSLKNLGVNIEDVREGKEIESGKVYLHRYLGPTETEGRHYFKRYSQAGGYGEIDHLMKFVANNCGEQAIGVVLSGSLIDGAEGATDIKNAGGKVLVQVEDKKWFHRHRNRNNQHKNYPHLFVNDMAEATLQATNVDYSGPLSGLAVKLNDFIS